MTTNPLALSEILAYCEMVEIPNDERPDFVRLMQAMDGEYLSWSYERSKSREKRGRGESHGAGR